MVSVRTKGQYNILYGQSYLLNLGVELKFLDELESVFFIKRPEGPKFRGDYSFQAQCITDISEKIGFLYLALDYIKQLEGAGGPNFRLIKYHFYNFVYDCKACLDSVAVLLNHQLALGFRGGSRDFRKMEFRSGLKNKSVFFKDFTNKFGSWCDEMISYRDRIIHQVGVPVFTVGKGPPEKMWKPSFPHHIPKKATPAFEHIPGKKMEYVEIIGFCEQGITKMMAIVKLCLSEIYHNIRPNLPKVP